MADVGADAAELGRALRAIRLSLGAQSGLPLTQAEMARQVFVGGKGVVSLFESGKRIPADDVVRRYCELVDRDPGPLLLLRREALGPAARPAPNPALPEIPFAERPATKTRVAHWRTVLVGAVAGLGLLGSLGAVIAIHLSGAGAATTGRVRISTPHGTVPQTTPVTGSVRGWRSYKLWVDVQVVGELARHPTDNPCRRVYRSETEGSFVYDKIYVGTPGDTGRSFRISVVAVRENSSAEAFLLRYGRRPKYTPNAYAGLPHLPAGARTVASVVVRRS